MKQVMGLTLLVVMVALVGCGKEETKVEALKVVPNTLTFKSEWVRPSKEDLKELLKEPKEKATDIDKVVQEVTEKVKPLVMKLIDRLNESYQLGEKDGVTKEELEKAEKNVKTAASNLLKGCNRLLDYLGVEDGDYSYSLSFSSEGVIKYDITQKKVAKGSITITLTLDEKKRVTGYELEVAPPKKGPDA